MKRDTLRKVEVLRYEDEKKVEYTGYFHEFYTQEDYGRNFLRVIIELETGEIRTESTNRVRFIS